MQRSQSDDEARHVDLRTNRLICEATRIDVTDGLFVHQGAAPTQPLPRTHAWQILPEGPYSQALG